MTTLQLLKQALASSRPDVEICRLVNDGLLDNVPEIEQLKTINQNPQWHPEGNAFNHTLCVVRAASIILGNSIANNVNKEHFMMFALLHDTGKLNTTKINRHGQPSHYGHEHTGAVINEDILTRLGADDELTDYVVRMTKLHMYPHKLQVMRSFKVGNVIESLHEVNATNAINDLLLFHCADNTFNELRIEQILSAGHYEQNLKVINEAKELIKK